MNFLERALDKTNHFGNYIWTAVIFFVASMVGGIPLTIVMLKQRAATGVAEFSTTMDLSLLGISQNMGLLLMLIPFAMALFACVLIVKHLHSRTFSETVNGTKKVRWNRAFTGFGVWFLLMLIVTLVQFAISPGDFTVQFDIKSFLPLLLITLLFIPLQTTCEEFLFRGYLTQGVAAWTKNRWLAVIIPGILFGLMHFANTEVAEHGFWAAMPHYIIFGLIFGLTAVLDDGIELAIGMHAAHNIASCLLVTSDVSSLPTPAIFCQHEVHIILETIILAIVGIMAVGFFARKYKWDFRVMNKKVEPLPTLEVEAEIE